MSDAFFSIPDQSNLFFGSISIYFTINQMRESNPGRLGEKREGYLSEMPSPFKQSFFLIKDLLLFWFFLSFRTVNVVASGLRTQIVGVESRGTDH